MNLYGISSILTGITSLAMAVFVYLKGYQRRLARIWSAFAFSAAFYGFGAYLVTQARNPEEALFWWQFSYTGIILLPFLFVCLVYEFLNIRRPFILKIFGAFTVLFSIANFFFKELFLSHVTLCFTEIKWVTPVYWIYQASPLLKFFIIFAFFGWVAYAHFEIIRNYKRISGLKRNQAKYFFFAASLGFIGGGLSFLPCFGIRFYPIFNFTVPLYFLLLSYAILRYRLMDIRIAITRTGIFVAVYTLLLGAPFILAIRLKGWLAGVFGLNWWVLPAGLMVASATVGPFIYIYLQRKAEDRLFKEQKNYHEALKQAGMEMSRIRNLQKLLDLIVHIVTENVRISHSAIYLSGEKAEAFLLKAGCNLEKRQPPSIDKNSAIIIWLKEHREPLVYEEIKQMAIDNPGHLLKKLEEELFSLNAAVIIPAFLEDKLLTLLVLGNKPSGRIYTSEDLAIFSILAGQMAIGIENALLYENIEEEVRQRTEQLLEVQKQLVQAEKLATVGTLAGGVAHEINNPLTAILTNVQMLLASGGEIDNKLDRESLELIEEATKRCRTIVQKLMAYSKKPLESTQISRVDLLDVIKNVLSFLGYQLTQDNIKIITEAKEGPYLVLGSHNELEQVVTNIILNARDATKQVKKGGEILISLTKSVNWIKMEIKDEGAGIPKEIISKVFDPFFTTKDVGKGLGLGLSICQAIVEKHNGLITIQSQPAKGSVVTVQLPMVKTEAKIKI